MFAALVQAANHSTPQIGVSNFTIEHLEILAKHSDVIP